MVSSSTSSAPCQGPRIACSSSASPYRHVHVVLLFCQLSGPIPSWHPHLPLCGSSLLCQRHGLQDEACHSCRGGPSTGTDGGGGRVSHGGVQEGTYVHRCGVCVWGGVECAPYMYICTVLHIGLCVWAPLHAYIPHVLITTAL